MKTKKFDIFLLTLEMNLFLFFVKTLISTFLQFAHFQHWIHLWCRTSQYWLKAHVSLSYSFAHQELNRESFNSTEIPDNLDLKYKKLFVYIDRICYKSRFHQSAKKVNVQLHSYWLLKSLHYSKVPRFYLSHIHSNKAGVQITLNLKKLKGIPNSKKFWNSYKFLWEVAKNNHETVLFFIIRVVHTFLA